MGSLDSDKLMRESVPQSPEGKRSFVRMFRITNECGQILNSFSDILAAAQANGMDRET